MRFSRSRLAAVLAAAVLASIPFAVAVLLRGGIDPLSLAGDSRLGGGNFSRSGMVTSALMVDPYVPTDGTMNVTGAFTASGASSSAGGIIDATGSYMNFRAGAAATAGHRFQDDDGDTNFDCVDGGAGAANSTCTARGGFGVTGTTTLGPIIFSAGAATTLKKYSATIDVVSVPASSCRQDTIDTADTADQTDDCFGNFPTNNVGLVRSCYYDGAQIVVNTCNVTVGAIDPASTTYTCTCYED